MSAAQNNDEAAALDIKYHWLRDKVKEKAVELRYISTHDQIADLLTHEEPRTASTRQTQDTNDRDVNKRNSD